MVGVPAVAESLGITEAQAQIIVNTLAAVAPGGPGPALEAKEGEQQPVDAREVDMHWLVLFLFVQMYSRPHVQASCPLHFKISQRAHFLSLVTAPLLSWRLERGVRPNSPRISVPRSRRCETPGITGPRCKGREVGTSLAHP